MTPSRLAHLDLRVPGLVRMLSGDSECEVDLQTVPATPIDDKREDSFVACTVLQENISDSPEIENIDLEELSDLTGFGSSILPRSRWKEEPQAMDEMDYLQVSASRPLLVDKIPPRRKALLIGIEYRNHPEVALDGPFDDVDEIVQMLSTVFDWQLDCITVLKDDGLDADKQPTKDVMIREINKLVADAKENDSLFLYYSGHGSQVKDISGDEADGYDETLVSSDCQKIIDDDLYELLVKPLPAGCRLTAIFDCCSSGTCLDLPVEIGECDICQILNKASHLNTPHHYTQSTPRCREPRPSVRERSSMPILSQEIAERTISFANVVCWSACQDSEFAHNVLDQKVRRRRGAMTKAFIESLGRGRERSYQELFDSLLQYMKLHNVAQRPNLSSSHALDMTSLFYL